MKSVGKELPDISIIIEKQYRKKQKHRDRKIFRKGYEVESL